MKRQQLLVTIQSVELTNHLYNNETMYWDPDTSSLIWINEQFTALPNGIRIANAIEIAHWIISRTPLHLVPLTVKLIDDELPVPFPHATVQRTVVFRLQTIIAASRRSEWLYYSPEYDVFYFDERSEHESDWSLASANDIRGLIPQVDTYSDEHDIRIVVDLHSRRILSAMNQKGNDDV